MKKIFGLLLFTVALLTSCERENEFSSKGKPIQFSATTSSVNTKTSYQGYTENGKEAILWENGDAIRVFSNEAIILGSSQKWADYTVSVKENGTTAVTPLSSGTELLWNDGVHHFFAVYPAGEVTSNRVSASIPKIQELNKIGPNVFAPKLSEYGFMAAAADGNPDDASVNLNFKPLFTTLEFTVSPGFSGDVVVSGFRLAVKSGSKVTLAGNFRATLSSQADPEIDIDYSNAVGEITVNLDSNGVTVRRGESLTFSVMALPHTLTDLVAVFTLDGVEREFPLVDEDGKFIVIEGGKKAKIKALNLLNPSKYKIVFSVSIDGQDISDFDLSVPDTGIIEFADPLVKARIVENFDTDGDGEISYAEAAAVTNEDFNSYFYSGSGPGATPPQYTSFDEFQYFTGLTKIPDSCFYGCASLQSLTLPSTITGVGQYALNGCRGIEEFVFPANVKSFGMGALGGFADERLEFLAEDGLVINENSFYGHRECTNKILIFHAKEPPFFGQHYQFGGSVGLIFRGDNILVPADAIYRYEEVWYQQKEYLDVIPETAQEAIVFADSAIKNKLVESFDTNSDGEISYAEAAAVTSEQLSHFFENTGMVSPYTSFDEFKYFRGLTSIPEACFKGCSRLTSIIIPTAIQSIEESAFENCSSLETLNFKESLRTIANRAFASCYELRSLTFHSSLTIDHPFGNPANYLPFLQTLTFYSFNLPSIDENTLSIPETCTIYVSKVDEFSTLDVWSGYASQFQYLSDWEEYWHYH